MPVVPDPMLTIDAFSSCIVYVVTRRCFQFTNLSVLDPCVSNSKSRSPSKLDAGMASPTDGGWHCDPNVLQLAGLGNAPLECCELDSYNEWP